jgi:hypothetical protein
VWEYVRDEQGSGFKSFELAEIETPTGTWVNLEDQSSTPDSGRSEGFPSTMSIADLLRGAKRDDGRPFVDDREGALKAGLLDSLGDLDGLASDSSFWDSMPESRHEDTATGLSRAEVERIATEAADRLGLTRGGVDVRVVGHERDFPSGLRALIQKRGADGTVWGAYFEGAVWLVAPKMQNRLHIEETLLHEAFGHLGSRRLWGPEVRAKLKALYDALGGDEGIRAMAEKYGIDLENYFTGTRGESSYDKAVVLADELLAHLAQSEAYASLPGRIVRAIKALVGALRQWLRDMGLAELAEYGETDLLHLLGRMRRAVQERGAAVDRDGAALMVGDGLSSEKRNSVEFASELDGSLSTQSLTESAKKRQSGALSALKQKYADFKETHYSSLLGALTLRQLADVEGKRLPQIHRIVDAMQQMQTARNQMADAAMKLANRWRKLPRKAAQAVADLMHHDAGRGLKLLVCLVSRLSGFIARIGVTQAQKTSNLLPGLFAPLRSQLSERPAAIERKLQVHLCRECWLVSGFPIGATDHASTHPAFGVAW